MFHREGAFSAPSHFSAPHAPPAPFQERPEQKAEAVRVAVKKIDQAVAKGILHKNAAARKKSQLAKKANA